MPRLVVLVDKDETGKLWSYLFTEEGWDRSRNLLETPSQWVHMYISSENRSELIRPSEPAEEDHVTLGLIPREEAPAHTRIKKKVRA